MNKFIEWIDLGQFELIREELKGRDTQDAECWDAASYLRDRRTKLERVFQAFQDWCGTERLEWGTYPVSYLDKQIAALVVAGDVPALEKFLHCRIDLVDQYGVDQFHYNRYFYNSILEFVIREADEEMVDYFLSEAYFLRCIESDRFSQTQREELVKAALIAGVWMPNHHVVETLLKYVETFNVIHFPRGLHLYAAQYGKTEIIERCLREYPVCFDVCDPAGNSALHLAASSGHLDIVKLLFGKIPYNGNTNNESPLYFAIINGHADVVEFLITGHDGTSTVRSLHRNWKTNTADWDWSHLACAYGYKNIYDILVAHGFEPKPLDRWGMTPLDYLKSNTAK